MGRLLRIIAASSGAALFTGCGSDQAVQFTATEPPEPASVRLFLGGAEVTQHVPLNGGETYHIEVRLYAANGARITGYDDHFELTLAFTPTSLATAGPLAGKPLTKNVTASTASGESGNVTVSSYHAHTTTSQTFGPFYVLVH